MSLATVNPTSARTDANQSANVESSIPFPIEIGREADGVAHLRAFSSQTSAAVPAGNAQDGGGSFATYTANLPHAAREDIFATRMNGQSFTDDPRAINDRGSIGLQRYLTPNFPTSRDSLAGVK